MIIMLKWKIKVLKMVKNQNEPIMYVEARIKFPNKTRVLDFTGTRDFVLKNILYYSNLGYEIKTRERWS